MSNVTLLGVAVVDTVLTARLLGARGKGAVVLLTTSVSTIVLFASCSLGPSLQVFTTRRRVGVAAAARFSTVWAVGTGSVILIAAVVVGDADLFEDLAVVGAALVPAEMMVGMFVPLFVSADRVGRRAVIDIAAALLDLVLTVGFILSGGDKVFRAVVGIVLARWVYALALGMHLWRDHADAPEPGWRRRAIGFGLRQHPGAVFARAAKRADTFLLAMFLGAQPVGVYSVAASLAELPLFVVRSIQPALVSFTAAADGSNSPEVGRVARSVLSAYAGLNVLYGVAVALVLRPILGDSFSGSVGPFLILLVGTWLLAYHLVIAGYLIGREEGGIASLVLGLPLGVNVALSLLLIPTHGLVGDAIATVIGALLTAAMAAVAFARLSGLPVRCSLVPTSDDVRVARAAARTLRLGRRRTA